MDHLIYISIMLTCNKPRVKGHTFELNQIALCYTAVIFPPADVENTPDIYLCSVNLNLVN